MRILPIINRYFDSFMKLHGETITNDQRKALFAMRHCRTEQYGNFALDCNTCHHNTTLPNSCGNRSCPHCQHFECEQWLERQKQKLLPVNYHMATFTLPFEFRQLAYNNQKIVYDILIKSSIETIEQFIKNDEKLGGDSGIIAVIHTNARNGDHHPHAHIVIPSGCIRQSKNGKSKEWTQVNRKCLFNKAHLAKVFRAIFLKKLKEAKKPLPTKYPNKWIAHCKRIGKGLPALTYLSRYLYRGVISEKNIIDDDGTHVTFQYIDGKTKERKTRKLKGEDFIKMLMRHVLPKGFRRTRNYGFMHGNAKKRLHQIQRILYVILPPFIKTKKPPVICTHCGQPMVITGFIPNTGRPT